MFKNVFTVLYLNYFLRIDDTLHQCKSWAACINWDSFTAKEKKGKEKKKCTIMGFEKLPHFLDVGPPAWHHYLTKKNFP